MKKNSWIIILSVILIIIITFLWKINYNSNVPNATIPYDIELPENVKFIDANKSENFVYSAEVAINKVKSKNISDYISLQILVTIEPKYNKSYKDVTATVFIDESIFEKMAIKNYPYFGTDVDFKSEINTEYYNENGIQIERGTLLYRSTDLNKLKDDFKKGIKTKVKWEGGEEYVLIPDKNIKIEVY